MVKRYMPNHLVAHWLELLGRKRRFDEDAQWNFAAGIEEDTDRLRISPVSLDLAKAPVIHLAVVASKLSHLAKELRPYLKKRHEEERRARGDGAADSPYDLDYLREDGLDDLAEDLQGRLRAPEEADGEDDPGRGEPQERAERDLTKDVDLPGGAAEDAVPGTETPGEGA
jgi:hypothetical protein